jgi:hypothetical protein
MCSEIAGCQSAFFLTQPSANFAVLREAAKPKRFIRLHIDAGNYQNDRA